MKTQIRVVSIVVLMTFLFSTFLIPSNINARVEFKREVSFGEPGESPFGMDDLQNDMDNTSNVAVGSEYVQQSSETSKNFNIWYLCTNIIFNQFFNYIF